jgi:hypothetical protein
MLRALPLVSGYLVADLIGAALAADMARLLSTGMQKCTRNGNEKCTTLPGMTW